MNGNDLLQFNSPESSDVSTEVLQRQQQPLKINIKKELVNTKKESLKNKMPHENQTLTSSTPKKL